MSLRLRALLACALLAPVARPASAADALLERVERALAATRGDGGGAGRPRAARREPRAEGARAAGRVRRGGRPSAAAEGAAAPRGDAAGLGGGAGAPPGDAARAQGAGCPAGVPRASRLRGAADVDEALELLRRIRAASRTEPLSEGELKTRIPDLRPPALAAAAATQVTAGDEPPIGTIAPEIRAQGRVVLGAHRGLRVGAQRDPARALPRRHEGPGPDAPGVERQRRRHRGPPDRPAAREGHPRALRARHRGHPGAPGRGGHRHRERRAGAARLQARRGARRAVGRPRRHRRDPRGARVGRSVRPVRQLPRRGPRRASRRRGFPSTPASSASTRRAATTSAPPASTRTDLRRTTSPPPRASRPASSTASGPRRHSPSGGRTSRTKRPSRGGT